MKTKEEILFNSTYQKGNKMKMRELLATPDKWTQGAMSRDKDNKRVPPSSEDAVKFCLAGALYKCYDSYTDFKIRERIALVLGQDTIISVWNDYPDRTHKEVLDLLVLLNI